MATYRVVQLSFWTDRKVEDEFTAQDKYFYLFLLTNPYTNLCGCYELSPKQMSHYTGYNETEISNLIQRMSNLYRVCKYSVDTNEILLLNWHRYNWSKSEKMLAGVYNQAKSIKSAEFRAYIMQMLVKYGYSVDEEYTKFEYPMDTSITIPIKDKSICSSSDIKQDNEDNSKAIGPINDKKKRGKNKEYTDEFETFWSLYPRKEGKGKAFDAFEWATNDMGVSLDAILDGVRKYKKTAQWNESNGKFIPHPVTWLNQKRWEDSPQPMVGNDGAKKGNIWTRAEANVKREVLGGYIE